MNSAVDCVAIKSKLHVRNILFAESKFNESEFVSLSLMGLS
jgi:hypothetical protein